MLSLPSAILVSRLSSAVMATAMPPVSVATAPELPCPSAAAIQQALATVRGSDTAVGANAFALRLERLPSGLRADLSDPLGVPVWSRALTTAPSECESAARAVALIVERHFRELAWTPEAPTSLASPPGAPSSGPATLAVAAVPAPPSPMIARQPLPRLVATAGPAFWTRTSSLGVLVDARARLSKNGPVFAGLGVFLPPSQSTVDLVTTGGQVKVAAFPVLAQLGVAHGPTPRLTVHAGVELLLTVERGQTQGIAVPATAWRTVLAAGVGGGGSLALGEHLLLAAQLGVVRAALGRSYAVEGIAGNVLDPPRWQAMFGLGLGWILRP